MHKGGDVILWAIAIVCLAVYVVGIFVSEGIIQIIERMTKDDKKTD